MESGLHQLVAWFVPWSEAPPRHFSRLVLMPLHPRARLRGSKPPTPSRDLCHLVWPCEPREFLFYCLGAGPCKHLGTEQVFSILTGLHWVPLGSLRASWSTSSSGQSQEGP